MQSILGALLTAGYASAFSKAIASAPNQSQITNSVQTQLESSFASAESIASRYPQYATAITDAAKSSFVDGADWAYAAGIAAVVLGALIVFFLFPKIDEEKAMLAGYAAEDEAPAAAEAS
jgi:DHA2 family multidrug resistance protein-like MFS transporter